MLDNLSYLAGIVDGEGHVSFSSCGVGKKRFIIEVSMTSENIIDWLYANYGGIKSTVKSNPKYKQQWRWRIQNGQAKDLYLKLKPLLKIKNTIEL